MRVIVQSEENCTYRRRSQELYGSWAESYEFRITDVRVAETNEALCYGEEGYQLPDDTTVVHVISMDYDTGDSFGRASGKGAIVAVFGNRKKAEDALKRIEAQKDEFSIKVTDDFEREVSISNPGAGYFEHINSIVLESFHVGDAETRKIVRKF